MKCSLCHLLSPAMQWGHANTIWKLYLHAHLRAVGATRDVLRCMHAFMTSQTLALRCVRAIMTSCPMFCCTRVSWFPLSANVSSAWTRQSGAHSLYFIYLQPFARTRPRKGRIRAAAWRINSLYNHHESTFASTKAVKIADSLWKSLVIRRDANARRDAWNVKTQSREKTTEGYKSNPLRCFQATLTCEMVISLCSSAVEMMGIGSKSISGHWNWRSRFTQLYQ